MCFQVRTLCVNLPASVEVTPVHSPPAVRRGVPSRRSLIRGLPQSVLPDLGRHVRVSLRGAPHLRDAGLLRGFWGGRRRADDRGTQVMRRLRQNRAQRVGGKDVSGRELLRAVRRLTAGIRIHAVGF